MEEDPNEPAFKV
jgi:hypothetical protein